MKKRRLVAIVFGILALGWTGTLFFFSGQNAVDSSSLSRKLARLIIEWFPALGMGPADLEPILRKIAHFGIFALEGFLTGIALINALGYGKGMALSFAVCTVMAVGNELHQLFSVGRSCEVRDMFIDAGGALTGILFAAVLIAVFSYFSRRKRKNDHRIAGGVTNI